MLYYKKVGGDWCCGRTRNKRGRNKRGNKRESGERESCIEQSQTQTQSQSQTHSQGHRFITSSSPQGVRYESYESPMEDGKYRSSKSNPVYDDKAKGKRSSKKSKKKRKITVKHKKRKAKKTKRRKK